MASTAASGQRYPPSNAIGMSGARFLFSIWNIHDRRAAGLNAITSEAHGLGLAISSTSLRMSISAGDPGEVRLVLRGSS